MAYCFARWVNSSSVCLWTGTYSFKALNQASGRHSKYTHILDSTAGVAFLGTPFRGSSDGFLTTAQLRLNVAKSMGGETANELVKYLSRDEEERKQLDDAVQEFCDLASSSAFKAPIWCFYEQNESSGDFKIVSYAGVQALQFNAN